MRSTGSMAIAYQHLKRHLGIEGGDTLVFDTGSSWPTWKNRLRAWDGEHVFDPCTRATGGWRPYTPCQDGTQALIAKVFAPCRGQGAN